MGAQNEDHPETPVHHSTEVSKGGPLMVPHYAERRFETHSECEFLLPGLEPRPVQMNIHTRMKYNLRKASAIPFETYAYDFS